MTPEIFAMIGLTAGLMALAIQVAGRINKQKETSSPARVIPWAGNDLECYLRNADHARARGDVGEAEEWELMLRESWEEEAWNYARRIVPAGAWGR